MKKIRSIAFLICLICTFSNSIFGQAEEVEVNVSKKNAIMLEGLGHGFIYSINYERILLDLPRTATTVQIGFSYYGESGGLIPLWMPITMNQMFKVHDNRYIEIGAGRMLNDDGIYDIDGTFSSDYQFDDWVFRAGFRLHSNNQKWVLRAGYTPIYRNESGHEWIHWGALAIGYRF